MAKVMKYISQIFNQNLLLSHLNAPSDVAISLNRYSAPTLLSYFRINLAVSE